MEEEGTFWIEVNEETLGVLKNMESLLGKELIVNAKSTERKEIVHIFASSVFKEDVQKIKQLLRTYPNLFVVKRCVAHKPNDRWIPNFDLELYFYKNIEGGVEEQAILMSGENWEKLGEILVKDNEVLIKTDIEFDVLDRFPEFLIEGGGYFQKGGENNIPISIIEFSAKDEKLEMFDIELQIDRGESFIPEGWNKLGKILDISKQEEEK